MESFFKFWDVLNYAVYLQNIALDLQRTMFCRFLIIDNIVFLINFKYFYSASNLHYVVLLLLERRVDQVDLVHDRLQWMFQIVDYHVYEGFVRLLLQL